MRAFLLFLASGVSALALVSVTPATADACCCWGGCYGGYGWGWGRPAYYNYGPGFYGPGAYQHAAPRQLPQMAAQPMNVVKVTAKDNSFDPVSKTIKVGTTVEWTNSGMNVHTVTSDDGKFDSGDIPHGGVFRATFVSPGTYRYHCKHHKGMVGTIIVEKEDDKKK